MKKISYMLLTLVLSIIMIPMAFAKDEVKIESYELVDNTATTEELSDPKIDGLNISFDLSFSKVNDYAKYKIVVDNPTAKDYELSKDTEFDGSDYIDYTFEFEKDSNIVPAKSKLTMYIIVTYAKEVPASMMKDGKFIENNKMAIGLAYASSASKSNEVNPKTGNNILVASVLLLTISGVTILFLKSKNRKKLIFILLLSASIIPAAKLAIEKIQINVSTKVTIEKKYQLSYYYRTLLKESEKDNYNFIDELFDVPDEYVCESSPVIINGEEYINCYVYTYSMHTAGERITPEVIQYNEIITPCDYDSETGSSICNKGYRTEIYPDLFYNKKDNKSYRENDIEIMDFDYSPNGFWSREDGYVFFSNDNKFTMPEHDVVIYAFWAIG